MRRVISALGRPFGLPSGSQLVARLRLAPRFAATAALILGACAPRALPPRGSAAGAGAPARVEFRLRAPDAERVSVVGSFNGWNPEDTPLHRRDGIWTGAVDLQPGRHRYAFWVDGAVKAPPFAPRLASDEFGGRHGIIVVPHDLEGRGR